MLINAIAYLISGHTLGSMFWETTSRRLNDATPTSAELAENIPLAIMCMFLAAFANGATQCLLGIDPMMMKIKLESGSEIEKARSQQILSVIEDHHWLLCTVMLINAGANEALPIFLDVLVPSWVAILMAVTLVLIAGEIIPAAIFTGKHQIYLGSLISPIIWYAMRGLSPIAYPLAMALDAMLGKDDDMIVYNRYETIAMMKMQLRQRADEQQKNLIRGPAGEEREQIHEEEIYMIEAAFKARHASVSSVMTSVEKVFSLSIQSTLNFKVFYINRRTTKHVHLE
jgi:metal transporter CNNM